VKPPSSCTVQVSTCACDDFCSCPVRLPQIRECEVSLKKRKLNEEESSVMKADLMVKRIDDELKAKNVEFIKLCKEKTDLDEKISTEEEKLNACNKEIRLQNVKNIKQLDLLKLRKGKAEEEYKQRGNQVENFEVKIATLKVELDKVEEAKSELVHEQDLCEKLIREVRSEKSKLEQSIEKQQLEDDEVVGKKKLKILNLKARMTEVLTGIENLTNDRFIPSESDTPYKVLREFIEKEIDAKEKELECPICMEVAASPILTCSDQHLICSLCRAKTEHCPVCSRSYQGKMKRHRYAEQALEEVDRMKKELEGLK